MSLRQREPGTKEEKVLRSQGDAEPDISTAITIAADSTEHTCIRSTAVIASTTGERIARIHDVSGVGEPARA